MSTSQNCLANANTKKENYFESKAVLINFNVSFLSVLADGPELHYNIIHALIWFLVGGR